MLRKQTGIRIGNVLGAHIEDGRIVLEKRRGDVTKMKHGLGRKFDWKEVEAAAREAAGQSN
jgi:hypothetical protein